MKLLKDALTMFLACFMENKILMPIGLIILGLIAYSGLVGLYVAIVFPFIFFKYIVQVFLLGAFLSFLFCLWCVYDSYNNS